MNNNPYDKSFYDDQKDGSYESAELTIPVVMRHLRDINSVLDLGCGLGTWLSVFKKCEINKVTGVDGEYINRNNIYINTEEFINHDLSTPFNMNKKFDLVMSLEVAEHLPIKSAKIFVDSLCRHGDIILFSAAIPGQGGTHHINEQYPSYWAELFKQNGYSCIDCLRPQIWNNKKINLCYRQNIMFYIKENSPIIGKFVPPPHFHNLDIIQ